jgi:RimJ/RimL family protein N-acetyltransferase
VVSGQTEVMDRLAVQIRQALEAADFQAYADLLDRGVRWGAPGDPVPSCRNRQQVLAWYQRARDSGTRARVSETVVAGDKILIGLKVTGRPAAMDGVAETTRWQVLTVGHGRITGITGFAERDEAAAWAGLAPPPAAPPGAIEWVAPPQRLADDLIGLRLPEPADAVTLHGYVSRDGGLDGGWAPLPADASLADCQAVIDDWLAGWRGGRSFHGPALVITPAGDLALAGLVEMADRGGRVAELSYGIAPDRRDRGYAARAARLVAGWLLQHRQADLVELRIDPANVASQRAALAAGFTREAAIRQATAPARPASEDLRFVVRGH